MFPLRPITLLAVVAPLAIGCAKTPGVDDAGFSGSASQTDGGTSGLGTDSEADGESTTGTEPMLDVPNGDGPLDECESVTQSGTIEELPNDILVIADPQTDQKLLQAATDNLGPQLLSAGIEDARVVLLAGPPPPVSSEYPECGEWTCWTQPNQGGYFEFLEAEIGQQTLLTDLLALTDLWHPYMRENSWKHIWIESSYGTDTMTDADAFLAQFAELGGTYANVTVHALMTGGPPNGDFRELAERTGGALVAPEVSGTIYSQFALALQEQLSANPLACSYTIPPPPSGLIFDRKKVNVDYDDGLGLRTLGYLEGPLDCVEFEHGWYYDDVLNPTEILMCPETCDQFALEQEGTIEIRFGCTTIPAG